MKMENLIGAVGVSVQQAQSVLEQAAIDQYLSYFNGGHTADGECLSELRTPLLARTLSLVLPGEERVAEVPLLALINHNTLRLERVSVRLNLSSAITEENGSLDVTAAPLGEAGHSVELMFRCESPSEAVARISDNANKLI